MIQNQLTSRAQFDEIVKKGHWRLILLLVGVVTLYTGMVLVPDYTAKKPTDPGVFLAELDRLRWRMSKSEVEKIIGPLHPSPKSDFEFDSSINTCGELWTTNVFFVRDGKDNIGLDRLQIVADGPNVKSCARCMEEHLRAAYGKPKDGRKILAGFEEAFGPQEGVRPSDLLYFTKGIDKMEFDTIGGQSIRLFREVRSRPHLIASPSRVP
jgi:hypothetical protein